MAQLPLSFYVCVLHLLDIVRLRSKVARATKSETETYSHNLAEPLDENEIKGWADFRWPRIFMQIQADRNTLTNYAISGEKSNQWSRPFTASDSKYDRQCFTFQCGPTD